MSTLTYRVKLLNMYISHETLDMVLVNTRTGSRVIGSRLAFASSG